MYTLVFDASEQLSGFFISPHIPAANTDTSLYVSEDINFRKGQKDETNAKLLLPQGDGPFPVAILIPGSGLCNMDAVSYGISVFGDLVDVLIKRGIATLRFDKYTYAHSDLAVSNPDFTIEEEYVSDVEAALFTMRQHEKVKTVYFVGHSQGAMLLPRLIHQLGNENFAGAVSIAGTPLHLWELQFTQNMKNVNFLPENQKQDAMKTIQKKEKKASALSKILREEVPNSIVFGILALYQWDEMQYDAGRLALNNRVSMFFIQGEADFQITPLEGLEAWKKILPEADYVLLPNVTHMLTKVEHYTGTVEDYVSGSKVDEDLIENIANWIVKNEQTN